MSIKSLENLVSPKYTDIFDVCIANTDQLKEEAFRLRYQVYCEELQYEPLSKFPNRMEIDIYDSHSVHCLLKYKPSNSYIGYFRLVFAENPDKKFPLENFFPDNWMDFSQISRLQFAEVSRLMVVSEFRSPSVQNELMQQINEENLQISFPILTLSLYLSFISILVKYDINYGLALMEPKLARHSRTVGFTSHPVGQNVINFNGVRRPCLFRPTEIIANFSHKPQINYLFNIIQARIGRDLSFSRHHIAA